MDYEIEFCDGEIEKPKIVERMMGSDFNKYFEVEQEDQKQAKYAWDALHPI